MNSRNERLARSLTKKIPTLDKLIEEAKEIKPKIKAVRTNMRKEEGMG